MLCIFLLFLSSIILYTLVYSYFYIDDIYLFIGFITYLLGGLITDIPLHIFKSSSAYTNLYIPGSGLSTAE